MVSKGPDIDFLLECIPVEIEIDILVSCLLEQLAGIPMAGSSMTIMVWVHGQL